MPQSHPTTSPVRFLSHVRFLARKAEWNAHRNFNVGAVLVVTLGYGPRTIWQDCTFVVWSNNSQDSMGTPCGPVRASYGPSTEIFNVFHILRDPYGARAGPVRVPYGTLTDTQWNWHKQNWQKSRTGVVFCRAGPVRAPCGFRTGCSRAV